MFHFLIENQLKGWESLVLALIYTFVIRTIRKEKIWQGTWLCDRSHQIRDRIKTLVNWLRRGINSLRWHLILLVIFAVIAAFCLVLSINIESHSTSERVQDNALRLTSMTANNWEVAFARCEQLLISNLTGLVFVAIIAIAATSIGSHLFVLRRVRSLLVATQQLAAGDLSVRIKPSSPVGELNQLAQAFDIMADSLEQSQRRRNWAEAMLRGSERRYHHLAASAPVGICWIDLMGNCVYVNDRWCQMTGLSQESAVGNTWGQTLHPDERDLVIAQWTEAVAAKLPWQLKYRFLRPDRSVVWVFAQAVPEMTPDGEVSGYIATITDISDRELAEAELRQRTFYDALTGLPNRVLFLELLQEAIAKSQQHNSVFAVLVLNLDRFQLIKYTLGYQVAEQLLIATAHKLTACLRHTDTIARMGADEFAILLLNIQELSAIRTVADLINQELAASFHLSKQEVFSSATMGIVPSSLGYNQPEDFLQAADTALHQAKLLGKGRHVVFDQTMHAGALERLNLEMDLLRAIEHQQFQVYYQPIVSMMTGKLSGFEALVRWLHPTKGIVSPLEFIPLAEESGLVSWIDHWVLQEACRQLGQWQQEFTATPVTISVNLSSLQLSQVGLIERVARILQETGISGHSLKLEITESMMMLNSGLEITVLKQLKKLGIQLSIDDFGTGYSSLSRLYQLPIDTLKIDRSFVNRIGFDPESLEILRTIISLAHNLEMDVIAEGIETVQQLTQLQLLQCEYGQGFFFSQPVDSETALKLITDCQ